MIFFLNHANYCECQWVLLNNQTHAATMIIFRSCYCRCFNHTHDLSIHLVWSMCKLMHCMDLWNCWLQVQAVLLLLGSREIPAGVPTIDVPFDPINRVNMKWIIWRLLLLQFYVLCMCFIIYLQYFTQVVDDTPKRSNLSRRIASLVRFREKRKERCFDKKIRYNVRKEVAQR